MAFCTCKTTKDLSCRKKARTGSLYCYLHGKEMLKPTALERIGTKKEPASARSSIAVQCRLEFPAIGSKSSFQDHEFSVLDYVYDGDRVLGLVTEIGRFYASSIGFLHESGKLMTKWASHRNIFIKMFL